MRLPVFCFALAVVLNGCPPGPGGKPATPEPAVRFTHPVRGGERSVSGIQVLSLQGTPSEMGYAEGALLCGRVTRFFQGYYLDFLAPLLGKRNGGYAAVRRQALERISVPEADEHRLRGLLLGMRERCAPGDLLIRENENATSRELQYEDLVAGLAMIDILMSACSSLTVWGKASATGGTLHGRNLDFLPDPGGIFLRHQMIKVHVPDDGAPWAALSWPGNPGCPTCFAGDGSGQSGHGGNGLPSESGSGNLPSMLAARDAFLASLAARDGGDRMAAAEAVLERSPTMTRGANLHFFWPGPGGAAVLEYDGVRSHPDGRVTVRRPTAAGSGLREAMACVPAYEKRRSLPLGGTNEAMNAILTAGIGKTLPRGGLDTRGTWRLLAASAAANPLQTLHALVIDMENGKLLLAFARKVGQDANLVEPAEIELRWIFEKP